MHRERERERERERQRKRERGKQTDRQTDKQTKSEDQQRVVLQFPPGRSGTTALVEGMASALGQAAMRRRITIEAQADSQPPLTPRVSA
jgi:hypothetical protein